MTNAKRKSRRRLFLVIILLLGVAGGTSAYIYHRKRQVPLTVQTEKADLRNITELVVANGKIQPVVQVVINPEVSGEITELPVKEGQRVQKGEMTAPIFPVRERSSWDSSI